MGDDLNTYRSRVGTFVSCRGAGVLSMPLSIDFSVLIKIIGSVSFVRMLLLIAGIEQNPGPGVMQEDIMEFYLQHFTTLPVLPLFDDKCVDLKLLYKVPKMRSLDEIKREQGHVKCHGDIFSDEIKSYNDIYIVGDAGVGKTSFCMHLCLMWSLAKSGHTIEKEYAHVSEFDFMFYINLRDTDHYHVIDMITERYFESYDSLIIHNVLRKYTCCIILDNMEEWRPRKKGRRVPNHPDKVYSDNCTYFSVCRPHRVERVRLGKKDTDFHINLYGIHGNSVMYFNENIIDYLNKEKSIKMKLSDFEADLREYGLADGIINPLINAQLVALWHDRALGDMTRSQVYANILEMLFQRAVQRKVSFPPSTVSKLQLPDSLSRLRYINEYVSSLYSICYLCFSSMFHLDVNVSKIKFTRDQLEGKPYCFSDEESDFLCQIGVISTHEVPGFFSVEKLSITFIHNIFPEFFAALFVSSFDTNSSVITVAKRWKCLNDVVQYENFFLFLAGFSSKKVTKMFKNIYLTLSDDLKSCRRNALFHYNKSSYRHQIKSFQNIIVSCFKEICRSSTCKGETFKLRIEDFVFDKYSDVDVLRKHLVLNTTNVKSLHLDECIYLGEFDQLKNLQCVNIVNVSPADIVKFSQCMLQNKSTLHTVGIEGDVFYKPLIPELLVRSLNHLTSLSLSCVRMQHNSLQYLVKYLSDHVRIENINLSSVSCDYHQGDNRDCTLVLNLPKHTKLTSLCLWNVNVLCNNVNTSSLLSVTLWPLSERIVRSSYVDLFNCLKDSQLEHLYIDGYLGYRSDYNTMNALTSAVKTLPCILLLKLWHTKLHVHDDVLLQLHPNVAQAKVELDCVTMSRQCFHYFVDGIVNNKCEIKVGLYQCRIRAVNVGTRRLLSAKESLKYMSEYLESKPTVNISFKTDTLLDFETTNSQ